MGNKENFEKYKQNMIDENEEKYGEEVKEKYGAEAVKKSNDIVKNMSKADHDRINCLWEEIIQKLAVAFKDGNPGSEIAQETADLHRQWLSFYWGWYTKEAHVNMANMYVEDERFRKHYDSETPGTAEFLRDAITIYTRQID